MVRSRYIPAPFFEKLGPCSCTRFRQTHACKEKDVFIGIQHSTLKDLQGIYQVVSSLCTDKEIVSVEGEGKTRDGAARWFEGLHYGQTCEHGNRHKSDERGDVGTETRNLLIEAAQHDFTRFTASDKPARICADSHCKQRIAHCDRRPMPAVQITGRQSRVSHLLQHHTTHPHTYTGENRGAHGARRGLRHRLVCTTDESRRRLCRRTRPARDAAQPLPSSRATQLWRRLASESDCLRLRLRVWVRLA